MTRKPRVLFVCLGNACRSQMAEGFARACGEGLWDVESAGLMPTTIIAPLTRQVMEEKKVSIEEQFPKGLDEVNLAEFDLIVNMSGFEFPVKVETPVREWRVDDPMGRGEKKFRKARDEIEKLVLELAKEARVQI